MALKEEMDCPDSVMATQGSLLVIVLVGWREPGANLVNYGQTLED